MEFFLLRLAKISLSLFFGKILTRNLTVRESSDNSVLVTVTMALGSTSNLTKEPAISANRETSFSFFLILTFGLSISPLCVILSLFSRQLFFYQRSSGHCLWLFQFHNFKNCRRNIGKFAFVGQLQSFFHHDKRHGTFCVGRVRLVGFIIKHFFGVAMIR